MLLSLGYRAELLHFYVKYGIINIVFWGVKMRDCTEIYCWWAGFIVEKHLVDSAQELGDIIESLKQRLSAGKITFAHVGVVNVLTELCVDGVNNGVRFRLCDLKK